ncbi:16S rRNA processing protein RimM [candidate division LCP-89 bacterium B3_LCP]|uniref:Ribosome maturation factor RimM n=1 Tax=candidate division LCP-89 bacterium B3_LCP TaxID=2012998 RepID=A0A532UXW1_UNCL8|nr:MAG: 16S rRNA processing protein RimM [candidate division LCP-89 bacterium B3_LCP]
MRDKSDFIEIATITKPVGLRGEFKVLSFTRSPQELERYRSFYMFRTDGSVNEYRLDRFRMQSNSAVLKFSGIDRREEVELLQGENLHIHTDQLPILEEDEYRICDLIGLTVISDQGDELGSVVDVMELSGNDIYVVKGRDGELLIPAISDVILNIDLDKRLITVHLIEGLKGLTNSTE